MLHRLLLYLVEYIFLACILVFSLPYYISMNLFGLLRKQLKGHRQTMVRKSISENAVHYFVSYYDYYQPEAYMPITDTYIEKEAMINEEIDRLRHASTQALLTRKDVIIVASVSTPLLAFTA